MSRKSAVLGSMVAVVLAACGTTGVTPSGGTSSPGNGDNYPSRAVTWIVGFDPGGGQDTISRQVVEGAKPHFDAEINVLNRPGASGTIGVGEVLKADPDGYTIGISNNQTVLFSPQIINLSFKGLDDFQPIVKLAEVPCVLAVKKDAPWKTTEEFLTDARQRPGAIRAAVAGRYSMCDLTWLGQFAPQANIDVTTVPFTGGSAEAAAAVLGGQVEAFVGDAIAVNGFIQSGDMRPLLVLQDKRHFLFPDTTSMGDLQMEPPLPLVYFVLGPKGMDPKVVETLRDAFTAAMSTPEFDKFAKANGYQIDPLGPDELRAQLLDQQETFTKLIDELQIEPQS